MGGQSGMCDLQEPYAGLSESGDVQERLSAVVDFEVFRPTAECCADAQYLVAPGTFSGRAWSTRLWIG